MHGAGIDPLAYEKWQQRFTIETYIYIDTHTLKLNLCAEL